MKKLNKKGFTLVELLAVIVVLALLMVVAASSIGSALTNAKKNTLKTEAQKIITNVYQNAYSQYMLNGNIGGLTGYTNVAPIVTAGATTGYTITGIDGKYEYTVKVDTQGNVTNYCVNFNKAGSGATATAELSIKETGITTKGAYTISDSAAINESICSL